MEKNQVFSERLMAAIKQRGCSINQIERELGYPRNILHNYKKGMEPSGGRLLELAHYFQLSPAYLLGKEELEENPSCCLAVFFHQLPKSQKIEVLHLAHEWSLTQLKEKNHEKRMV